MPQSLPTAYAHNLSATGAPTVTSDSSQGYVVGSMWINVTAHTIYICCDSTVGAAVWTQV